MNRQDNYDGDNFLTAHKPRPWGEGMSMATPTYSRPDPSSKTNIRKDSSVQFVTGSMVIPWNTFTA